PVEDNRRHAEVFALETVDVRVQREEPVLSVDRPQNSFALRHLQDPDTPVIARRLKRQLLVARDDDGAGNRRQIPRLAALLVLLHADRGHINHRFESRSLTKEPNCIERTASISTVFSPMCAASDRRWAVLQTS